MKTAMKSDVVGCLVYRTHRGNEYLCGFETFDCGNRFLPYFSLSASSAFPLSRPQADFILARLDYDIRVRLDFTLYPRVEGSPDIFALEHSPIGGVIL